MWRIGLCCLGVLSSVDVVATDPGLLPFRASLHNLFNLNAVMIEVVLLPQDLVGFFQDSLVLAFLTWLQVDVAGEGELVVVD